MAIYDLDRSQIDHLLAHNVSAKTEARVIEALKSAGDYPSGSHTIPTEYVKSSGSVAWTVPSSVRFFLEEAAPGKNVSEKLKSKGDFVAATGDGNVKLNVVNVGGAHNDTLVAGSGKDQLTVHTGRNELIAGSGHDTLIGGAGHDTLEGGGHSKLVAGSGDNLLIGGYKASSHDTLIGGSGSDTLRTSHGHNVIHAGSGHDTIYTGSAHDTVYGATGSGHSTINVGAGGSDVFHAKSGFDTVYITKSGDDTIFGGSHTHTTVHLDNMSHVTSDHKLNNGLTKIVFGNGQTIEAKDAKIIFSDGHSNQNV